MISNQILIIEDETDVLNLVEWHMHSEGFSVLTAQDGNAGLDAAIRYLPDLIILDLIIPGIEGLEICKMLKRNPLTEQIPVVMLTAKGQEVDRIVGFELGAEDYIVKPFSPRELILRVRTILKRFGKEPEAERFLQCRNLRIDRDSYRVWINEEEIALTLKEFKLLLELIQNRGKILTREQLLARVWQDPFDGSARTIDTHIRRLRKKLGADAEFIETVRGIGYRFKYMKSNEPCR